MQHGTAYNYRKGCRCSACRVAVRLYQKRKYRQTAIDADLAKWIDSEVAFINQMREKDYATAGKRMTFRQFVNEALYARREQLGDQRTEDFFNQWEELGEEMSS